MSWLWGSGTNPQYEELVEQACSPMKLQFPQGEDMALNLEITDMIRSKAVQPKPAMQALKKRVASKNGRVQMYALSLIDTCIKNGGDHFLAEIASKEFVDEMSGVIRSPSTNPEVRTMALRYFQQWALAFQSKPALAFLVDVYNELKNSGIKFPPPPVGSSSHMLETATAPAWVDSDYCMRCRSAFTFTNRKHHCRSCGLIFDQACSSRVMPLPKFGIKEEVRVCEGCWLKAEKNKPTPAVPGRTPRSRQDYDADLQRAIELSLAQAQPGAMPSEPPIAYKNGSVEDDDEQLRLAIEASLREMERAHPSAPSEEQEFKPLPTFDLNPRETETILAFTNTIDQMAEYGERDLRRFPQVHMLASQAHAVGGKLQRNSEEKTTKTQMLMEMQNKLTEAVQMYGQILDGQAAYAARKAHEAQQQYAQQWAQPAQPYAAYQPNANGYQPQQPYAPQAQQQPPQQAPAQAQPHAPSMYPSMPAYGYQPQQPYAYQPWQQPQQPQQYHAQPAHHAQSPVHQAQSPRQQHQQPQHTTSPAPVHTPAAYAPPTEHSYASYASPAPEPQLPSAPPQSAQPQPTPSGPPPIDLASHPSMSPRSSHSTIYAATPSAPQASAPSAPSRSASYTSPIAASAPLASPPVEAPNPIAAAMAPSAPTPAAPSAAPVSAPSAPNPWTNEYSTPAQHQQQQPYPASMFPSVPTGLADPVQKPPSPKREEALLIEL